MAIPPIRTLSMKDIKSFGNLARTNLYQVFIEGGWGTSENGETPFLKHLKNNTLFYGINDFNSIKDKLSILCSEATLPSSSYATAEVKDNFMGVSQEFAHSRINTDIDFTFYIDRDYQVLAFFEAWIDFISGGSEISLYNQGALQNGNYYRRFNYPNYYKTSQFYIKKFEKDWATSNATNISYQLINAFPKTINSIPVAYGESEILKITITMNYDRYILRREYAPYTIIQDQLQFQKSIDPGVYKGDIPGTRTVGQSGAAVLNPNGQPSDFFGGPGSTGDQGLA